MYNEVLLYSYKSKRIRFINNENILVWIHYKKTLLSPY